MSLGRKPSAISGVSAEREAESTTIYPSICAWSFPKMLGQLFDSIPIRIMGVKLSHLLFVLPFAPLAILLYFLQKAYGQRYILTNRNVQVWKALGSHKLTQMALSEIADVQIVVHPGQQFYKAADLLLVSNKPNEQPLVLAGVPRAPVFRQTILKARDARIQVSKSLETIKSRPSLVG